MRYSKTAAVVAAVSLLAGGCSSHESMSSSTTEVSPEANELEFQENPITNFSASDCENNPDSWAEQIDPDPQDAEGPLNVRTVGMAASREADGSPIFLLGATIEGLGDAAYKLAIADSESEVLEVVNLEEDPYSKVLNGTENYDAVFTARLGEDNRAYFRIDCLPNFRFYGNREPVYLDELSTIPPNTTLPQPTDSESVTA